MPGGRVKLRPLRPYEGKKLVGWLRQGKDAIAVRRAEVILRASQGEPPEEIARALYFSADYARKLIHRFNEEGLDSIQARYCNGGRPKALQPEHEAELMELVLTPPRVLGLPFNHWSLERLREQAIRRKRIPRVSLETMRRSLLDHGLTPQRTKTWKQSSDPEFEEKKTASSGSTKRPRRA